MMTKDIIRRLIKFRDARDWEQFHTPENLAKSVSIEAGELLECFQWSRHYDASEVKDELADVFIYGLLLANTLGFDLESAIMEKIDKNERSYPVSKSKGTSTKYSKL